MRTNLKTIRLTIAITGASGQIYAKTLIDKLFTSEFKKQNELSDVPLIIDPEIIFSETAVGVWSDELSIDIPKEYQVFIRSNKDFYSRSASGSNAPDVMIIIPCSMGTIGRIASGVSSDLITRSADVMLKERKKLIIVPRETPFNLIHLRNLTTLAEAGAIIAPASPSFYKKPADLDALIDNFVSRILDLAEIQQLPEKYRWQ